MEKENAWSIMTEGKKASGYRHLFRVVLEFLDDNGVETSHTVLNYYPKSKDEATKIAKDYPITKGERTCVYEYDDTGDLDLYNIYTIKEEL